MVAGKGFAGERPNPLTFPLTFQINGIALVA